MDLFTRSVDASLQFSRAYDEPNHFSNPSAAAESLSPITCTPPNPISTPQLIISIGRIATAAVQTLHSPNTSKAPVAILSGVAIPDVQIILHTEGPLKGCASVQLAEGSIGEDRGFIFAEALLNVVKASSVLVVCGKGRVGHWAGMPGVRVLRSAGVDRVKDVEDVEEPAVLGGVVGGVMAEAEMKGVDAVCVVGEVYGAGTVDDVMGVLDALRKVWELIGGVKGEEVGIEEVRKAFGKRGGYENIYM